MRMLTICYADVNYMQSWAALLWNVASATATVKCSAATLAATIAKIIKNL